MTIFKRSVFPIVILSMAILSGCSTVGDMFDDDPPPLEGERISVLELQKSLEPDDEALSEQGLVTPPPWRNEFWPQAGGYPNHSMQNLALNEGALKQIWKADIGRGSTDELPLTAQPIVVNGHVYTLDTDARLMAFDAKTGKKIWERDAQDPEEDDPVISGGIAYASGLIYVANGYDEIVAVRPVNGEIAWRKSLPAPSRAAPTILDQRVFVTTLDNRLIALDSIDGTILWEHSGLGETAGLVGMASAAASNDIVIPAFSSGELTALRVENGSVAWSDNLANLRRFGGLAGMADIRAMPVIDKGLVIAISFSGRFVAIDQRSGTRVWQREIGGLNTPWIAGNHIFVLSADNELVALGRETGSIRWVNRLPKYKNPDSKKGPIVWTGPVLAGGRLLLAGTDGRFLEADPVTGKTIRSWDSGSTVTIQPVIADGTLFLLSDDGRLTAYR